MRISTLNIHNKGLADLMSSQEAVTKLMNQVSTGKKNSAPSDDPIVFDRTQVLKDTMSDLHAWKSNIGLAENQLSLVESTLTSFEHILSQVDEIQKQAINGYISDENRAVLAQDLSAKLNDLLGLANTKDSTGSYIFSGYASFVKPYIEENGTYVYQGNSGERELQVGVNTQILTSFSGISLFESVKEGNGTFVCSADSHNTGLGIISQGTFVNANNYVADNYTIHFVSNGPNQVAYYVDSPSQGRVIPTDPQAVIAFDPNQSIGFNGLNVSLTQMPNPGDQFYIAPSKPQNIFNSIQELITTLQMPTTTSQDKTLFLNEMDKVAAAIEQGYQQTLLNITNIGSIMNTLESESTINDDLLSYAQQTLSLLEDVDMVEVVSQYTQQMTVLQAAQMSYAKIQGLSLFNFI